MKLWVSKVLLWARRTNRRLLIVCTLFVFIGSQMLFVEPVHAAISQRGTVTSANSAAANVTSLIINKPTGVVANDVMIATITVSNSPALTLPASGAGWTAIEAGYTSNGTIGMQTYRSKAGASEPASYTWSWTGTQRAAGTIVAYSGVDGSAIIDNAGAAHSTTSGSSTTPTALAVTTSSANALLVASFLVPLNSASSLGQVTGMTELTETASNSATTPNVDTSVDTATQASAGTSGTKASSVSPTNTWVARLVALKPAAAPTLNQTAYRWSVNADNNYPEHITDNLTAVNDTIRGSVNDPISSVFYTVGDNGANWVIEKRRIADGALCTSTNCGTTFGTAGRITEDIASSATEIAYNVAVDASAGRIYVIGMDNATGGGEWRTEKRDMLTGALDNSFNTTGFRTSNGSAGADEPFAVKLDKVNGYLYVGGYDGSGNNQWRLEKYRTSDGALCTAANCGTQFGTGGVYTNNVSNGDDRISAIELDPTNTYLFVSGYDAKNTRTQWTMYKLRASDAAVCSAANCVVQFGVNGLYNSDPSTRDDKILTLQVDSAANAIYLGGFESPGSASSWRIEKISVDTGVLDSSFGNNGSCSTNNTGAVCATFTAGNDQLYDMELDGSGGYLYAIGETDNAGTNSQWKIQKRNRSDGSLVSAFATSGTASIDPSIRNDPPTTMVVDIDRGLLWAEGGDRTLGATNMQWYFTELQLDTGTMWLASANTVGGVSSSVTFRLRLLLRVVTGNLYVTDALGYKLQYSPKVGTCDTSFVGENYVDMAKIRTNDLLYQDNPSVANPTNMIVESGQDPTDGANTVVPQSVRESNNFSADVTDVLNSQDGMWDFTINDNGAFGAYCFRVVDSAGTVLSAYTQIPEITFCKDDPKTAALLRGGAYFCEGVKKPYFWANANS